MHFKFDFKPNHGIPNIIIGNIKYKLTKKYTKLIFKNLVKINIILENNIVL